MVQQSSLPVNPMETNEVDDETISEKQRLVSHGEDDNQGITFA